MPAESALLRGWGRAAPSAAHVVSPRSPEEISLLLKDLGSAEAPQARAHSYCIPRGLGRSYGDAAQSAGGTVVETDRFDHVGPIDADTGSIRLGAGVSLERLLAHSLPHGWFLPVTPGTRHVTVGGAIAADVHGKNHHADGGFGRYTEALTLASPTGVHELSPSSDPELFWATLGGLGLTGVVTAATIRLQPVETSWMEIETSRCANLDSVMSAMEATDASHRYSVAWIDTMTRGRSMGRSVLTQGDHALRSSLPQRLRHQPLQPLPRARLRVPRQAPQGLLNRVSVGLFNEAWFRAAPKRPKTSFESIASYFYPLDGVTQWNLLYGRLGFVQYQFCVGPEQGQAIERVLDMLSGRNIPSFLGILKRFGPANPGPLSFPIPGWTLALDLPIGVPQLQRTLMDLDELVTQSGGRVYLAKDARLSGVQLSTMYPRLSEFDEVRRRIDPSEVLGSDLSRRLGLTPQAHP
jgi:decaprenylphospho-beta-D-ribofuranose 2-oxidase